MNLEHFEKIFEKQISEIATTDDPAHDLLHFQRVVKLAKKLCSAEGGRMDIVVPAAWLHDFVIIPKDSPLRSQASKISAEKAVEFLKRIEYPAHTYGEITHAIEGHSFSANIEVKTLEAKIVQDADRLDGLGAIGIARCFAVAALLKRPFYNPNDPFCSERALDDAHYTIDHFYKKLFKTADTLKTAAGRREGETRVAFMKNYLDQLNGELF